MKDAEGKIRKGKNMKAAYLCFQRIQEGQASYAHVTEIIKGLTRRGWDTNLFVPPKHGGGRGPSVLRRFVEAAILQVRLWFKAKEIDVLYIRSHVLALPTIIWAKIRRIPVVQEINGPYEDYAAAYGFTKYIMFILKRLCRLSFYLSDHLITVTPKLSEWASKESGHRIVSVIPNGANTELFVPRSPMQDDNDEPYVVFFGALAPWQGIDTILRAANLPNWPTGLRIKIIGDGAERSKVEKAATRNTNIEYFGAIPYNKVPGVVSCSLAGLCIQNNLGGRSSTGLSPLKLFETLACGVPAIVSDFPGLSDFVSQNNCGIVIPADDPCSLAEAVKYLLNNPAECSAMGRRGCEIVQNCHSWDIRAEQTERVLFSLVKRRK